MAPQRAQWGFLLIFFLLPYLASAMPFKSRKPASLQFGVSLSEVNAAAVEKKSMEATTRLEGKSSASKKTETEQSQEVEYSFATYHTLVVTDPSAESQTDAAVLISLGNHAATVSPVILGSGFTAGENEKDLHVSVDLKAQVSHITLILDPGSDDPWLVNWVTIVLPGWPTTAARKSDTPTVPPGGIKFLNFGNLDGSWLQSAITPPDAAKHGADATLVDALTMDITQGYLCTVKTAALDLAETANTVYIKFFGDNDGEQTMSERMELGTSFPLDSSKVVSLPDGVIPNLTAIELDMSDGADDAWLWDNIVCMTPFQRVVFTNTQDAIINISPLKFFSDEMKLQYTVAEAERERKKASAARPTDLPGGLSAEDAEAAVAASI